MLLKQQALFMCGSVMAKSGGKRGKIRYAPARTANRPPEKISPHEC